MRKATEKDIEVLKLLMQRDLYKFFQVVQIQSSNFSIISKQIIASNLTILNLMF